MLPLCPYDPGDGQMQSHVLFDVAQPEVGSSRQQRREYLCSVYRRARYSWIESHADEEQCREGAITHTQGSISKLSCKPHQNHDEKGLWFGHVFIVPFLIFFSARDVIYTPVPEAFRRSPSPLPWNKPCQGKPLPPGRLWEYIPTPPAWL